MLLSHEIDLDNSKTGLNDVDTEAREKIAQKYLDKAIMDEINLMTRLEEAEKEADVVQNTTAEEYTRALLADTENMLARCPPEDFLGRMGFESMAKQLREEVAADEMRKKIFYNRE